MIPFYEGRTHGESSLFITLDVPTKLKCPRIVGQLLMTTVTRQGDSPLLYAFPLSSVFLENFRLPGR